MAALLLIAAVGGCGRSNELPLDGSAASDTFTIVATTAMIGDIVRNIADDRVTVHVLMGPGVDPHLYRPTRSDMNLLLEADLVFYNGLNLEGRMTDSLLKVARTGIPVHAVTELIDEHELLESQEYEGFFDPHLWMDPRGWIQAAAAIIHTLSVFDPDHAETYSQRGGAYLRELRLLDRYVRDVTASIPEGRRVLVTAHDAFGYFARAYDIEVHPIQGISTESEVGLRRIEELIELIVSREIPTVFTESSVPDRNIRALIEGARARGHAVEIGGELFSDAMGEEGTWQGTYIGMIDHNATTIARALGGSPPDGGFRAWREQAEDLINQSAPAAAGE